MCGIFGTIKATPLHNRMLTIFNEQRGRDSVGILADLKRVRCDCSSTDAIVKRRLTPRIFCADTFLGHTRSRTHGLANKENAHPFRYGNICGAHNGVISNHWELKNQHKQGNPEVDKMNVDSQIIFWLLNKMGTDGLKELDGYAACWWQDLRRDDRLYLWSWSNEYYLCENLIDGEPCIAFSSVENHLLLAGFLKPEKIDGKGHLLEIDTKAVKIVNRSIVEGAAKRNRGEWRESDAEMRRRTGVPTAYFNGGFSSGGNPTNVVVTHATQPTLRLLDNTTGGGSSPEDEANAGNAGEAFFCHSCSKVMPGDIVLASSKHKTTCPSCGGLAEHIHRTDAEWIWENFPGCIMSGDDIASFRLLISQEEEGDAIDNASDKQAESAEKVAASVMPVAATDEDYGV